MNGNIDVRDMRQQRQAQTKRERGYSTKSWKRTTYMQLKEYAASLSVCFCYLASLTFVFYMNGNTKR